MKKLTCLLLCVCLLLCLAACHAAPAPQETQGTTEGTTQAQTNEATQDTQPAQVADSVQTLSLEKALYTNFEWDDTLPQALVHSEHSYVTLSQEDAEKFPQLAQQLTQVATMQKNTMDDEFQNLVSLAREEAANSKDSFETYVSRLDVQVRRADTASLSLLAVTYSHYGNIKNFRSFHGTTYDVQSGKVLMINEVVDINNDLALAVQEELKSHTWTGDFYTETAVEDYFANTPYDGFSWTLDYNGVTFYFAPGDLCDEGAMVATISFADHPEFFNEKYTTVPVEYTVELPRDISFFTQLDDDEALDALSLSTLWDSERSRYTEYSIYTDIADTYYCEECFVSNFHPYYVKSANGQFLYLFREDFEEGTRQMSLSVLSISKDGNITKLGDANLSPSWLADNIFAAPTNPGSFLLEDADSGSKAEQYSIGSDGMPIQ